MIREILFWIWHRWFGHGDYWIDEFTKPGRPPVRVRVCERCNRVYPEDVLLALDAFEADLEAEP